MLEIHLLGKFAVTTEGRPVELPLRAAQSLLAYLALTAGTPHRREQLAGLLWPEADEASAKGNLRHTLWRLRKALGSHEVILADDLTLMWDPATEYWLDAEVVARKLPAAVSAEDLMAAISAYGGELLPGFYDDWVVLERERLQAAFEHRMEALLERLEADQRWKEMLEWGERWIALGHTPEAAYRALITAHGSRGDAAGAATAYRHCLDALQADLGVEPSAQTRAVYARWAQGGSPAPAAAVRAIRGYELQDRIGGGAFGVVYRAFQPAVQRQVAIKVIAPQHASRPDFIRRFEAEARLVAQLEHPHIVPLFDYWRDPEGAYLVMRLLPRSLRAALERAPFTPEATVLLVEQIASALAVAHRHGIAHLDLKPDNILLDDDGNAYLADFGIARSLSEAPAEEEGVSGSLEYVSPEQLKGEPVTPRADFYGLGLVIYEMVAGRHPFSGQTPSDLIASHLQTPLPDLRSVRQDLPRGLNRVVQRATAKDPAARYADVLALAADWRLAVLGEAAAGVAAAPVEIELPLAKNPYKGLRAFEEADAADFFGREALMRQLTARLGEGEPSGRFLALIGASGSGKSSVVKAGLVPALRQGAVPGSAEWFISTFTPGDHPLASLATALLSVAARPPAFLLEQLQTNARGLVWAADTVLAGVAGDLLLVVDQFEELFTLTADEAERAQFLALLHAAVSEPRSRVRVLIVLRADFTDRPLQYPAFGELMRQHTEFILPLSAEELGRAVTGPARRVGVTVDADLLAALVADVNEQPGALPMLQYALTETFEHAGGRQLTLDAYHAIGGLSGALARRADEVFTALNAEGQAQARQVFLRLVTLGEGVEDTRRRVLRAELESLGAASASRQVLEVFGRARLLYFDRDPATRTPTVEVAHEALLREWPRLRDWLSASRADVRLQRQLALAALDWQNANRDASFLLSGARLAQFEGWAAETQIALTGEERAFLEASLAARQAQEEAEAARQKRELEAAHKLAETEKRRAEEQSRNASRLRQRAVYLVIALGAALVLLIATLGLAQLSNRNAQQAGQNLAAARAANTQAVAEVQSRSTAQAQAQEQKSAALGAQATAQAEAYSRATAEAQAQAERNTAQAESQVRAAAEASAVQAQANAEQQAALAFARELDAAAELQLDKDPQLSLLLALQAISVTRSAGLSDRWDVQQTLHNVMPAQRLLWTREVGGLLDETVYSSDGKRIAIAVGITGTVVLDADTRQTLVEVKGLGLALSPDGKLLATGEGNALGTVYLWDAITGQQLVTITGHPNPTGPGMGMNAFAFSPDGNSLATGGDDGVTKVWDLTGWRTAGAPAGTYIDQPAKILGCYDHTSSGYLGGISFSPDGKRLVTDCDKDKTAKVWDMASGQEVLSVGGDTDLVFDAHFSPDGKRLATTSADGTARLWDAATGKELLRLKPDTGVGKLAFSPDGQHLATTSDELVIVWDLNTGARLFTLSNPSIVWGLVFSLDGKSLVVASGPRLQAWDVTSLGPGELAITARQMCCDFNNSRDGTRFADIKDDGTLSVYDSATLQELWETKIFTGSIWGADGVSFSADNALLSASVENTATVWKADSGEKLFDLVQPANVMEAALSPDGLRLAAGLANGNIVIWDLATRQPLQTLTTTLGCILSIEFSPDGMHLAAAGASVAYLCSGGGHLLIWDLAHGADPIPAPLELPFGGVRISHLDFSPDSQRLATSADHDGAKVWEVTTGQAVFTMTAHTAMVRDINYSPDGKYLVTAAYDKTAKVWNAQTSTELLSYQLPDSAIRAFFTPQNQGVVIAVSGSFISYRLNTFLDLDGLLAVAHARLVRGWQPGECLKYLHTATCPGRP